MQKCVFFRSYRNINLIKRFIPCKLAAFNAIFEMMPDIRYEIKYKTARSGGKGGQNVNKVETMVEGYWDVEGSQLFSEEEKARLLMKLANKINADGKLLVKSQEERSQLANKEIVQRKMNEIIAKALLVPRKRRPTKPSLGSKLKRLDTKKKASVIKQNRQKPGSHE